MYPIAEHQALFLSIQLTDYGQNPGTESLLSADTRDEHKVHTLNPVERDAREPMTASMSSITSALFTARWLRAGVEVLLDAFLPPRGCAFCRGGWS